MEQLLLLLVGFTVGYWVAKRKFQTVEPENERQAEVLKLFEAQTEVANDDVQRALGISDATATRYLDKLEKSGKIVQIGEEGRFVKYRLKQP